MTSHYRTLIFRPKISNLYNKDNILWKAQITKPDDLRTINTIIIEDNIKLNNRRYLKDWINFFQENSFNYKCSFDSEFCKEFFIEDSSDYYIQLFACDIKAYNNFIEIDEIHIMAILYILDLKKSGTIFPNLLMNKIENAKIILKSNGDQTLTDNASILKILNQLNKLSEICQNYECDIEFQIEER